MFEFQLSFDAESHSIDAIQRAVYRLSDRISAEFHCTDGAYRGRVWVDAADEEAASRVVFDFRNEVVDQVLRERIRAETAHTRNVILSLAFSQTALTSPEE
jgi:His-Xaa-Ser system protein HxsD